MAVKSQILCCRRYLVTTPSQSRPLFCLIYGFLPVELVMTQLIVNLLDTQQFRHLFPCATKFVLSFASRYLFRAPVAICLRSCWDPLRLLECLKIIRMHPTVFFEVSTVVISQTGRWHGLIGPFLLVWKQIRDLIHCGA
ncbi:hypothetical protein CPB83DRAFT_860318 [Crepidotus variabilis]|uniref:Uncharacterized protein n=1 Tax=Crepidotus variabilis TaxID=179855 RepID=A0A9P6E9K1_9AGAR|nr:hypothetical protein CPB83DRAFT_860318 [Crepidotus variabilis]